MTLTRAGSRQFITRKWGPGHSGSIARDGDAPAGYRPGVRKVTTPGIAAVLRERQMLEELDNLAAATRAEVAVARATNSRA